MRDNEEVTIRLVEETWENVSSGLISCDLTCYRGKKDNPCWIDLEPGMSQSPTTDTIANTT